jgi:methionine-rich copper-binding protein CopC
MTNRRYALLLPIAFLLARVRTADGHAVLLSATPETGKILPGSEAAVRLRFNSRIDGKRSRLMLIAPDGSRNSLDIGNQSSPDTLTSQVKNLKSGSYIIQWQVLASDGHITRGEVSFRVQ